MRKSIQVVVWLSMILILTLAAACSPKAAPTQAQVEGPEVSEEVPAGVQETEAPAGQGTEPPAVQGGGADATSEAFPGVPADIPIKDGAEKLQVATGGTNIVYQITGTIDDVVKFYQEQLPNYGWKSVGNPDTAVGSIATLLRENDSGERISVNMQFNPIGQFVRVTITLSRLK